MEGETTNILSWNFTNWLTVLIMVAVGFTLIALAAQGVHKLRSRSSEN